MPNRKYAKPPPPLPPMSQIERVGFRFSADDRRELMEMLPSRLHEFGHRDDPLPGRSGAELLVAVCEEAIASHRTAERQRARHGPVNPANVRAAIRKLRLALEPFATGAIDPGTVDVLLGSFLGTFTKFDAAAALMTLGRVDFFMAAREQELSTINVPPAAVRERQILRNVLSDVLQQNCSADMTRAEMARFHARVLRAADIEHIPDPDEHPERLIQDAG